MKIAILGYGLEGQSAYNYWKSADNQITICDQNESLDVPDKVESRLGPDYLAGLDAFDLIVRSPAIHPAGIVTANSPATLRKVSSVTNEFMQVCPSRNIIGVTGTKGKGTTSTLIAKTLQVAGKRVHLGGNIGVPTLDMLAADIKPDDWVVLELSNFQLIDLKYSPNIAVCLMVVPEHLNWHANMAEYVDAKQQLFTWQTYDDIAIYYKDNEYSATIAAAGNAAKVPYCAAPGALIDGDKICIGGQEICRTSELKLLGQHNIQNACAAITTVWQITHSIAAIRSVLTSFSGLPHRLELVREVEHVKYYNDSFAATPDAAMAALQAVPGPKLLIAGGFDRGLPIDHFAACIKSYAEDLRVVLLIGKSAQRLAAACDSVGFDNYEVLETHSMAAIVEAATKQAESGDTVVLSPGFASFDMFKNFEDRGDQYRSAVERI